MRLFESFGSLIGTGEYLSTIERELQQQALEQLRATRIGLDGYVAVIHRDGRVLLSPSNPAAEGRHYSELPPAEQAVIRAILDASAAGGGFTRYDWHERNDSELKPRLAMVSNQEDWDWVLVTSLSLDELHVSLAKRQERLEDNMRSGLLTTAAALVLALALALAFALLIKRWLTRRFDQYHADIAASNDRLRVWAESPLTQLPNRTLLRSRLDGAILNAQREDSKLALLFIDLDRFKNINDSLGHAIGDNLLIEVSRRLAGAVRTSDTVSRLGGDEFVVLVEHLQQAEQAAQVADKLLQATNGQYDIAGHELAVTLSIGIALYPSDGSDAETLLKNADAAMYHAKALGRNNYQFFTAAMNARVREHLEVENRLRQALSRSELTLHYQPQFDLASGALVGCEALMRWHNPILGQVSPDKFIGVAEDSGLILHLGEWALFEACRQVMDWERQGLPGLNVAVNVSAVQFRHADLPAQVQAALEQSGLPAERLELELTESVLAENREQVRITLDRLKQLGVRLAMDDFGTGYSSLSYLKHFKLDTLKIDRAFISDLPGCDDHAALAVAIIGMAEALGMTCIAEGIENADQHDFLRWHGCAVGQGFLLLPPAQRAGHGRSAGTARRSRAARCAGPQHSGRLRQSPTETDQRAHPLRVIVEAGHQDQVVAAGGTERRAALVADLLQGLDAVGDERRAHHQELLHPARGQRLDGRLGVGLDPLGAPQPRLEGHRPAFGVQLQRARQAAAGAHALRPVAAVEDRPAGALAAVVGALQAVAAGRIALVQVALGQAVVAEQQMVVALLQIGPRAFRQRRQVLGLFVERRQDVQREGQALLAHHPPGLLDHRGHRAVGELRVQRHQGDPTHAALRQPLQAALDGRLAVAHRQLHRPVRPLLGDLRLQAPAEHHQRRALLPPDRTGRPRPRPPGGGSGSATRSAGAAARARRSHRGP